MSVSNRIIYVYGCFVCTSVHYVHAWYSGRPEEGFRYLIAMWVLDIEHRFSEREASALNP